MNFAAGQATTATESATLASLSSANALSCTGNAPAPTNAGQPNNVPSKTGQCAGL